MLFEIVTIFPEYFDSLKLSLMGKAEAKGVVNTRVHNLRNWAEGRHLSVDNTPYGGGAGMVMRADVWGRALAEIFARPLDGGKKRRILAVPTPSGLPLTQAKAEEMAATAGQIVFACGRYEGIDNRIMEYYQQDPKVELWQFSLGDYVLNGGEVAALAAVETIGRLVEGFMGNPDSLKEESHSGEGLLEYPVYTKPLEWNSYAVPPVLLGGNHADIGRWRRDKSLLRTYERRPDIIARIDSNKFDAQDKTVLAGAGFLADVAKQCRYLKPGLEIASALTELVQTLFPQTCPEFLEPQNIAEYITQHLEITQVQSWIKEVQYQILVAEVETETGWELGGYCLIEKPATGGEKPQSVASLKMNEDTAYISKCYVKPCYHSSGLASALIEISMDRLRKTSPGISRFLIETDSYNRTVQKFYKQLGFKRCGTRIISMGDQRYRNILMVRELTTKPIRHWAENM